MITTDTEEERGPKEYYSAGAVPKDVHEFGAYIRNIKRLLFEARRELKGVREELVEIRDEELATILEARLDPTPKQADKGEPGSLRYSNDTARDMALREALRNHEEHASLKTREAVFEEIVNNLEGHLSQTRRDFPVLLVDYLARQPAGVAAAFASIAHLTGETEK